MWRVDAAQSSLRCCWWVCDECVEAVWVYECMSVSVCVTACECVVRMYYLCLCVCALLCCCAHFISLCKICRKISAHFSLCLNQNVIVLCATGRSPALPLAPLLLPRSTAGSQTPEGVSCNWHNCVSISYSISLFLFLFLCIIFWCSINQQSLPDLGLSWARKNNNIVGNKIDCLFKVQDV